MMNGRVSRPDQQAVRKLRFDLRNEMRSVGKGAGFGGVALAVVIWIVGAIIIAIVLEVTGHNQGNTVFDQTGFNVAYIFVCGGVGVIIAAGISWRGHRAKIRGILEDLAQAGASPGPAAGAELAGASLVSLALAVGAVGLAIGAVIYTVTAIFLIPILLAMTFFAFLF